MTISHFHNNYTKNLHKFISRDAFIGKSQLCLQTDNHHPNHTLRRGRGHPACCLDNEQLTSTAQPFVGTGVPDCPHYPSHHSPLYRCLDNEQLTSTARPVVGASIARSPTDNRIHLHSERRRSRSEESGLTTPRALLPLPFQSPHPSLPPFPYSLVIKAGRFIAISSAKIRLCSRKCATAFFLISAASFVMKSMLNKYLVCSFI